jgi:hypothetical protein
MRLDCRVDRSLSCGIPVRRDHRESFPRAKEISFPDCPPAKAISCVAFAARVTNVLARGGCVHALEVISNGAFDEAG